MGVPLVNVTLGPLLRCVTSNLSNYGYFSVALVICIKKNEPNRNRGIWPKTEPKPTETARAKPSQHYP